MAQPAASSDSLGLNVFKETEKTHVDVVSVHGLYGSREGTWIVNGSSWLEKCIFDRVWARIVQYGYSSGHESTVFTYEGIRDEATKLLVSLVELRNGPKSEVPIVFITHDIGGIIVKEVGE
ncbi:hypothetical protein N656DRAFT_370767 [Canariomyces notabilis]|uniref:DUF676 domain-containing protein n=1 Tax=Canariomyces notabilis TaxID=2074819 RepID=A0AAN6QF36_9PEZI|nr:hypothetical protein N656DRAFT_370767 [Canariomyces arenarius]